jgi:hypothetical protein
MSDRPTAEPFEPWEREYLHVLRQEAADPARHAALCRDYCHESLRVQSRPGDGTIEIGICSHYEKVPDADVPATYYPYAIVGDGDHPPAIREALARLVVHILAEAERGAFGC